MLTHQRTVDKTPERHPRKRPRSGGKAKWLQRLNDHENDKQREHQHIPNRQTRQEAKPAEQGDHGAQHLRGRQHRIDDQNPRTQKQRHQKRESESFPGRIEEFVQCERQDQPDDRMPVQGPRPEYGLHQQRPDGMPIFVEVGIGHIGKQPVPKPADQNQSTRQVPADRLQIRSGRICPESRTPAHAPSKLPRVLEPTSASDESRPGT